MEAMPALRSFTYPGEAVERPVVFIPVFPGSNCDYDTAKAFRRAGAQRGVLQPDGGGYFRLDPPDEGGDRCVPYLRALRRLLGGRRAGRQR